MAEAEKLAVELTCILEIGSCYSCSEQDIRDILTRVKQLKEQAKCSSEATNALQIECNMMEWEYQWFKENTGGDQFAVFFLYMSIWPMLSAFAPHVTYWWVTYVYSALILIVWLALLKPSIDMFKRNTKKSAEFCISCQHRDMSCRASLSYATCDF